MMLRRLFAVGLICAGLLLPATLQATAIAAPSYAVAYGQLAMFSTEAAAHAHCPSDTVYAKYIAGDNMPTKYDPVSGVTC